MVKVLVTGAGGTLGRRLVRELEERGHEVWQADIVPGEAPRQVRVDVAEHRQLGEVLREGFDYVYHLAAEFGRVNGERHYENVWKTNVIGTRNVLEWQARMGFRLVFASSSEIYGEARAPVLDEGLPLRQPVFPHNDYALSKWVNEQQIVHFERRHRVEAVRLRLFNAYGPGERYHPYRSVVCLFIYHALAGRPFTVFRGYHRAFMYVDDLIPTLANVLERFEPGEVYNVGGADYRSVEELCRIVLRETGAREDLVRYLDEDRHNTVSKRPDITKAVRDLGHRPQVTLEAGVPRTVAWMREAYGFQT